MAAQAIRFGVWAAVHGSRGALQDPEEPFDASWERNRALVLEAESLGYDAALVAQHTMNPYDDNLDQLEAWSSSAALAALTSRIEIITAIKPGLFHPVVLAKMASQIETISKGRFAINLVNAWNKAEFARAGLPFPHHDDRYAYGREWIDVVKRLLAGQRVTFAGRHFAIEDYILKPADPYRSRPRVYVGGESEPARALVTDHADVWLINGQPLEDVAALIADVARRRRHGAPVGFGLSAFVIARKSEDEARAAYERLLALAARDAPLRATDRPNIDPNVVMHKTMAKSPRVGTNGGTAAGLVGSYDQVADRIAAFHRAGIELFLLQFQPFEAEMRRFSEEVMPRAKGRAFDPAIRYANGDIMGLITRRDLLHIGGASALLAPARAARADGQAVKFAFQRSSVLLTILKQNKVLEDRLAPKGIEPSWYLFNDVIPPMTAGATDFHADVADAVPVFTQAAGAKLTIYAREAPSPQAEAIIVHADSPIATVADLKGKTVGVNRGSGAHFILAAALKRAGLSFADITPAYLTSTDGGPAFDRRSIDAWSIWDPFLAITESRGPVRRLADATGLSGYQRFYLVNDAFAETRPDVVQIVFDALVEAGTWVKSHPKEAATLLAPLWSNVPVEVVEAVNSHRSYRVLSVTKADLGDQQKIADTFRDAGLIPKAIDATDVKLWRPQG